MPVQTEHLAEEIQALTASVNGLRADFAGFKGSVEKELELTRLLGKFVAGILVAIVASGFGLAYEAGTLSAEVKLNAIQLEKRMDKLEARFDKLEAKVDQRFGQIDQQMGLIIQRLDQVVAKTKPN